MKNKLIYDSNSIFHLTSLFTNFLTCSFLKADLLSACHSEESPEEILITKSSIRFIFFGEVWEHRLQINIDLWLQAFDERVAVKLFIF